MHGAYPVPFRRDLAEIGLGGGLAGLPHGVEAPEVGGEVAFLKIHLLEQIVDQLLRPARCGQAVENPRAFRQAFGQARRCQCFQVVRQARLALAQQRHEFTHGQFAAAQQNENSQPGRLASRPQRFDQGFRRNTHIII